MKIKCGTDIIEISRIEKSIEDLGEKFLNKIYTKEEIEYCESKGKQKYQHYAARFAAKEAIFKAMSDKLNDKYELCWKDYEVLKDDNGKPYVNVNSMITKEIDSIDISMSHCREYAVATVIIMVDE